MYRIKRTHGNGFRDYLLNLWEGNDLPTFAGIRRNPYLFDDKATADRVAQRLQARYPQTMETKHFPSQPITYTVEEVSQHAWGQYAVYSHDRWMAQFPNAVPAGRYDKLDDAKKHADSVTYKMVVVDMKSESSGFVYTNWETTIVSIKRRLCSGDCTLLATLTDGSEVQLFSYYIDEYEFSDDQLIGKTVKEARSVKHVRDVAYLQS